MATHSCSEMALRADMIERIATLDPPPSAAVLRAFASLDRSAYAPGVPLAEVYPDGAVVLERDGDGAAATSISAAGLQAEMIDLLDPRAGERVLEVGSGGFNAGLLARVMGPAGTVISVDPLASVIDRARAGSALQDPPVDARFVCGDAWDPSLTVGDDAAFDAIMITVDVADVPWPLVARLRPGGRLLAPMRFAGVRALIRATVIDDDVHGELVGSGGFLRASGHGVMSVPGDYWDVEPGGGSIVSGMGAAPGATVLGRHLAAGPAVTATGVVVSPDRLTELFLWTQSVAQCPAVWSQGAAPRGSFTGIDGIGTPARVAPDGSLATLSWRRSGPGPRFDLLVSAYGPSADRLASVLGDDVRAWDCAGGEALRAEIRLVHAEPGPRDAAWARFDGRRNTLAELSWRASR